MEVGYKTECLAFRVEVGYKTECLAFQVVPWFGWGRARRPARSAALASGALVRLGSG